MSCHKLAFQSHDLHDGVQFIWEHRFLGSSFFFTNGVSGASWEFLVASLADGLWLILNLVSVVYEALYVEFLVCHCTDTFTTLSTYISRNAKPMNSPQSIAS